MAGSGAAATSRGWLPLLHLPAGIETFFARHLETNPLTLLRDRLRVSRLRKPLILGTVVAAGLLVLALGVLPSGAAGSSPTVPATGTPTTEAAAMAGVAGHDGRRTEQPGKPADRDAVLPPLADDRVAVLLEDDPVAAAMILLERRDECLAATSESCLQEVEQAGSALLEADRLRITRGIDGAMLTLREARIDRREFDLELVDRQGGAALVTLHTADNTQPVSLLLMKGETGWRMRDLFEGF